MIISDKPATGFYKPFVNIVIIFLYYLNENHKNEDHRNEDHRNEDHRNEDYEVEDSINEEHENPSEANIDLFKPNTNL